MVEIVIFWALNCGHVAPVHRSTLTGFQVGNTPVTTVKVAILLAGAS